MPINEVDSPSLPEPCRDPERTRFYDHRHGEDQATSVAVFELGLLRAQVQTSLHLPLTNQNWNMLEPRQQALWTCA